MIDSIRQVQNFILRCENLIREYVTDESVVYDIEKDAGTMLAKLNNAIYALKSNPKYNYDSEQDY